MTLAVAVVVLGQLVKMQARQQVTVETVSHLLSLVLLFCGLRAGRRIRQPLGLTVLGQAAAAALGMRFRV
jgi:hypothetical protein